MLNHRVFHPFAVFAKPKLGFHKNLRVTTKKTTTSKNLGLSLISTDYESRQTCSLASLSRVAKHISHELPIKSLRFPKYQADLDSPQTEHVSRKKTKRKQQQQQQPQPQPQRPTTTNNNQQPTKPTTKSTSFRKVISISSNPIVRVLVEVRNSWRFGLGSFSTGTPLVQGVATFPSVR